MKEPRVRLICVHYAGGNATAFRTWPARLAADVDLLAVQLPGRGTRMGEPLMRRLDDVVEALGASLPTDRVPTALFGHSMGAKISFALCRWLRARGRPLPSWLFVSGYKAPSCPDSMPPAHQLPDSALIARLRRYGGTPEQILKEPELMVMMLPILRADFELLSTFRHVPEPPLDVPVTALCGLDDQNAPQHLVEGWRDITSREFSLHSFAGGHFFVHTHEAEVVALVSRSLAKIPWPDLISALPLLVG